MKKPKVLYLVWESDGDIGYFNQFETLVDAVSDGGEGCEVYRAPVKYLGQFKKSVRVKCLRVKKTKTATAAKKAK